MHEQDQIRFILERNARVELDKAWEVSLTRRLSIAALTYISAGALLWSIGIPLPFLSALIPSGAYLLSMLSLPWVRKLWEMQCNR